LSSSQGFYLADLQLPLDFLVDDCYFEVRFGAVMILKQQGGEKRVRNQQIWREMKSV